MMSLAQSKSTTISSGQSSTRPLLTYKSRQTSAPVIFHDIFPEEGAQVFLRSKDGISFGVKRDPLITSSTVFATLLNKPTNRGRAEYRVAIPVIDLEEESWVLEVVLSFVYDVYDVNPIQYLLNFENLVEVVLAALDKYNLQSAVDSVILGWLPRLLDDGRAIRVLCQSCIYGNLEMAKRAIRRFKYGFEIESSFWNRKDVDVKSGLVEPSLSFLPREMLERIPFQTYLNWHRLELKVLNSRDRSYTWENAADDFSFD